MASLGPHLGWREGLVALAGHSKCQAAPEHALGLRPATGPAPSPEAAAFTEGAEAEGRKSDLARTLCPTDEDRDSDAMSLGLRSSSSVLESPRPSSEGR